MERVLLDTDVASLTHKQNLPLQLSAQLATAVPILSFVVVGELAKWTAARNWGKRRPGSSPASRWPS
jgi:hypothetical protein